jgi:hypothetical protein
MVFHVDRGTIFKHERTPEGFLRVHMRIARVGELTYRNADGSERIEVVSPEVLFDKDSTDSFKMKPITLGHPPVKVTSENARQYERGMTGHAITIDGDFLGIVGTVTDKEAIDAIERGDASEVSCGYDAEIALRSDGKYDQLSRSGNHVAAVNRGRAGSEVRFGLDAADPIDVWVQNGDEGTTEQINQPVKTLQTDAKPSPRTHMPRQITIGGEIFSIDDDNLANAILELLEDDDQDDAKLAALGYGSYCDAVDGLKAKLDAAEGKATGLEAQVTALTTKLDAAEQTRMDADQVSVAVSERLDAWAVVLPLLRADKADYQPDYKLGVADIRKLAIAAKLPNVKLDGKSDEYVNAVWDTIAPQLQATETRADSSDPLHELVLTAQRQDAAMTSNKTNPIAQRRKDRSKKAAC